MVEAELHEHWFIRICKESGFYDDLMEEGIEKGIEKGAEKSIITVLSARFGSDV